MIWLVCSVLLLLEATGCKARHGGGAAHEAKQAVRDFEADQHRQVSASPNEGHRRQAAERQRVGSPRQHAGTRAHQRPATVMDNVAIQSTECIRDRPSNRSSATTRTLHKLARHAANPIGAEQPIAAMASSMDVGGGQGCHCWVATECPV